MNYEDMSDFEINKLVALSDNRTISEERTKMLHYICKSMSASDSSVALEMPDGDCIFFDPCNDPSGAWPIILKNRISINPQHTGDGFWSACWYKSESVEWNYKSPDSFARDLNPLRAAMICFLKMKDAEK